MTSITTNALIALLTGFAVAWLLVIPYLVWTYRRRGELGLGHAFLTLMFLIYLMALWAFTLLPLPEESAAWCAVHATATPQLNPLQFLTDIAHEQRGAGLASLAHNPAVQQVVLNVVFFVPLGMFCRHLLRLRPLAAIGVGFGVSLLIEFTQLTGIWFLFQCPYRLFDVDDLIANTLGAAIGVLLAPLLRVVPGQRVTRGAEEPRPVGGWRRLLGIILDLGLTALLGAVILVGIRVAARLLHADVELPDVVAGPVLSDWVPAVVVLLMPALAGSGATPGQAIVRLRPVRATGGAPPQWARWVRFAVGSGGYFVLTGLGHFDGGFTLVASLLAIVSLVMVWVPRDHRGLTGAAARIRVVDARSEAAREGVTRPEAARSS